MTCLLQTRLLLAIVFGSLVWRVDGAAQIFGILQDSTVEVTDVERQSVYSQCFGGLGLIRCKRKKDIDDGYLLSDIEQYNDIDSNYGVAPWCLACCSHSLGMETDTWDLACDLDARTKKSSNVFGYEFRIARMASASDKTILRCPIRRSGCTYDADGELIACTDTSTFLSAYELTLHVRERYESFNVWLQVLSCAVSVQESSASVDSVSATIVMVHRPSGNYKYEPFAVIVLMIGIAVSVHVFLFVLRLNSRCDICDGRLVYSRKTCAWCRYFGTTPLDPKVLTELRHTDTMNSADTTAPNTPRISAPARDELHSETEQVESDSETGISHDLGAAHPHAEGSDWRRSHVRRNALAHAYSFKVGEGDMWVPQELVVPTRGGRRVATVVPM